MIDWFKKHRLLSYFILFTFVGFLFRAILILLFPQIYSWDGFRRLWNYEHIWVRHWLPLLQVLIFLFLKTFHSTFGLRFFLASIAGLTCGSSYLLGQKLFNHRVGLIFATLLVFYPLFVSWSIVPYQEALFLLFIFMGLFFYLSNNPSSKYLAAIFISLSCLTRYEGWILCGILIFHMTLREKKYDKKYIFCLIYFLSGISVLLFVKHVLQIEPVIGGPLNNTPFNERYNVLISSNFLSVLNILRMHLIKYICFAIQLMGILPFCFSIVGLFLIIEEKHDFKIYFIIYMLSLILVTAMRGLGGAFTNRMLVFPTVFLLFPMALCLSKIWAIVDHIKSNFKLGIVITLIIVALFAHRAVLTVRNMSSTFIKEYNIAKFIETLDPNSKILICPRPVKDVWGESTISAIIGNSVDLKINQNIFSNDMLSQEDLRDINHFIEKQGIDYLISYKNGKYNFSTAIYLSN